MPDLKVSVSDAPTIAARRMVSEAFVEEIRARDGFAERARAAVALWREPPEDDAVLVSTLRDMGRFIGAIWAFYLDSQPGGLTLSRLTTMLEGTQLSGPGRARAMIAYMLFLGYISQLPTRGDARLKRYVPTPRLLNAMRKRYRRELEAAAWMTPDAQWVIDRFDEPGVCEALIAAQGELMLAFFREWRPDGVSLNIFSDKYAGMMLLSELLATAEPDDVFPPAGVLRYSMAGLARNCGVSRTQIRRIMRAAADHGFLVLGEEGEAWPTPLLRLHVELAAVGQMSSFMYSTVVTRRRFDTAGS